MALDIPEKQSSKFDSSLEFRQVKLEKVDKTQNRKALPARKDVRWLVFKIYSKFKLY